MALDESNGRSSRGGDALYATVAVISRELVRRGIDPKPLLAAQGLHAPSRWLPLSRAPRGAILAFVDSALKASGDPALHVAATAAAAMGAFELADYLTAMPPTIGDTMRTVGTRIHLVNSGLRFQFDESGDPVLARVSAVYEPLPHPIVTECLCGGIDTCLGRQTAGEHKLARVSFSHADRGSGAALRQTLGCPIELGCGVDVIHLSRALHRWTGLSPSAYRERHFLVPAGARPPAKRDPLKGDPLKVP